MARFALIKTGTIVNVIEASPGFFEKADPAWLARFDAIREVVAPGETPATGDAIVTRDAEPGSTISGRTITRTARTEPKSIEERIAALETAKAR